MTGTRLDKNVTLVAADKCTLFDLRRVLPQCELTWDHGGVGSFAGTGLKKVPPPATQATGSLEDGVLEQGGKASQPVVSNCVIVIARKAENLEGGRGQLVEMDGDIYTQCVDVCARIESG